ncbi:ATP-binding protein [Streptomyces palmae]|uniref:ATP-binding protein n=1 Tax=Streptomyces palmae TaxID=1701085 RepID=UPI001FD77ECA|nr:ATP-binding protein [Streptomyces palmae]
MRGVLVSFGLAELIDKAILCVSELVTNVHQHAKGDLQLTVTVYETCVRVAVRDEGQLLPAPRHANARDTEGRGLFLVTAMSDACGLVSGTLAGGDGKSVWFDLAIPPGRRWPGRASGPVPTSPGDGGGTP